MPPAGNANFAWVQHIIHHLAPTGIAGFVLANGSMSSNQSGEGDIRGSIIEADLVDCMVALPGQLFYSTQIPACLWFLTRDKKNHRVARDRRGEVLFIDARKLGRWWTAPTANSLTKKLVASGASITFGAEKRPLVLSMSKGERNTPTSPVSANPPHSTTFASTATSSRPAAMLAPRRKKTMASRSRRR